MTVVTITSEGTSASEPSDAEYNLAVYTWTRDSTSGTLSIPYQITGSLDYGRDYTTENDGYIHFADGEADASLRLRILNDEEYDEGIEELFITLIAGSGYTLDAVDAWTQVADADEGIYPREVIPGCSTCSTASAGPDLLSSPRNRGPGSAGVVTTYGPAGFSSHPVRYADGTVLVASTDLESTGFGMTWGITRQWSNGLGYARTNIVGNGMVVSQQPQLIQADGTNTLGVITDGHSVRYFDLVGSVYVPRNFYQEQLSYDSGSGEYVLALTDGATMRFHGFSSGLASKQRGAFKSYIDSAGNTTSVTSRTTDGKIQEVQRSQTIGSDTTTESFLYTYVSTGDNQGLLASVTLRRKVNAGAWANERTAEYAYYVDADTHGNVGDLKTVVIKDGANTELETTYYRYYKPSEANGYRHGLKQVFYPASYARLVAEQGSNVASLSTTTVAPYADHYFEYDSLRRATKEIAQGSGCSTCSGGQGSFQYSYAERESEGPIADPYNSWQFKTVETLPDGNQNIVYTNYLGQVMLQSFRDVTTNHEWSSFFRYDSAGRVILSAQPSAVIGYSDSDADLLGESSGNLTYLRDNDGLVTVYEYYSGTTATTTTAGAADGYLKQVSIREGETGTAVPQRLTDYIAYTASGSTIYLAKNETSYVNANGTGAQTTTFSYTFDAGTQIQSQTVTPPNSDPSTVFYDTYGRPTWTKDASGHLYYTAYDPRTGAVVKQIADVDTTQTSDFANKPTGWTTPSGGGIHAVSTYEVDELGRTTKATDADGRVTYAVYNDQAQEIRIYAGWNSVTNRPAGPTIVVREDRAGSYTETLTMSAVPNVASGRPTGTEAISDLTSLTRTFTNDAGQVIHADEYFNLAGLTYSTSTSLGTVGTHFARTTLAYDNRGRQSRIVRADGTIFRAVFDGQGRIVSEWIGDNDTPTSGSWSPSNPASMELVRQYQYDGNGVGDGFVTSVTDALSRVTTMAYDFRGRLTARIQPTVNSIAPTTEYEYDNLNRMTEQTDPLDNVTTFLYEDSYRRITATLPDPDGAGSQTSPQSVRVFDMLGRLSTETDANGGVTTYTYDGLGRLKKVTLPDPDGSGSQTAPETTYQYDQEGNLRYVTDPLGNVTEYQYDALQRLIKTILPDPDGVGSQTSPETIYAYGSAGLLTSITDALARVTSYTYDALGRRLTETGPDPDGVGGVSAPVKTFVYDLAGRLASTTDPLGNVTEYAYDVRDNLTALTLPAPDDVGSQLAPEWTFTFDDVGNKLTQTDPLGRTTTHEYDALNRLTKTTSPDPDGAGAQLAPWTVYTYDAVGNLLTATDRLSHATTYAYDHLYRQTSVTNANSEVTSYTYDAVGNRLTLTDPESNTTTWTYDGLNRIITETNELSASRSFEYDLVGNLTKKTDRLNRVTEYSYDHLHRRTAEIWKSSGSTVRTLSYDYDAANQLLSASDPAASYDFFYDELGRTTEITADIDGLTPDVVLSQAFDLAGNRTQLAAEIGGTDDFVNDFTYDDLHRLTRLTQQDQSGGNVLAEKRFDFAYNAIGQQTLLTRYADVAGAEMVATTTSSYDFAHRLTSLAHAQGVTALASYDYTYDVANRITSMDSLLDGLTEYNHDDTNQLTGADHTGQTDESYTYDDNGNRTMSGYVVGANNRITSDGTHDYEYDAEGNMTAKETIATGEREEYAWDHRNRLISVTFKDGSANIVKKVEQTYDLFNRWVRSQVDADGDLDFDSQRFFAYDGNQIIVEFDGSTAADLVNRYVWSYQVDQLLAVEQVTSLAAAGTVIYALTDHLGTTRDLATYDSGNGTTAIANHRRFDSFGSLVSETNGSVTILIGFTGRPFDEAIDKQWNLNRWYISSLGVWMSEDPIGFEAGDANVRRYVGNSILHFTDPIGLDIYVENTKQVGGLHQRIAVDIWDNTGNKIGTLSISFGYDKDRKCGVVYEDLDPPTKEQRRYSTTPEQDAQIRELFLRLLGQTGEYQPIGVGANNCRKFSNTLFREIVRSIRQTGEVPDDTGFEVDPPSPLPIFPKPPRPVFPIKPPNSRPSVPVNPS